MPAGGNSAKVKFLVFTPYYYQCLEYAIWEVAVVTTRPDARYNAYHFPSTYNCTQQGGCMRDSANCMYLPYWDVPSNVSIPVGNVQVYPLVQGRSWVGATASFSLRVEPVNGTDRRYVVKMCAAGRFAGEIIMQSPEGRVVPLPGTLTACRAMVTQAMSRWTASLSPGTTRMGNLSFASSSQVRSRACRRR